MLVSENHFLLVIHTCLQTDIIKAKATGGQADPSPSNSRDSLQPRDQGPPAQDQSGKRRLPGFIPPPPGRFIFQFRSITSMCS